MELLMVLLFYSGILVFCFWLGEQLRRLQSEMRAPPADPPLDAQSDQEQAEEEATEAQQGEEPPLEPELLPDPRQSAQALARDLEDLAGELAGRLGLEFVSFSQVYPGEDAAKKTTVYTDLEEILPQHPPKNA